MPDHLQCFYTGAVSWTCSSGSLWLTQTATRRWSLKWLIPWRTIKRPSPPSKWPPVFAGPRRGQRYTHLSWILWIFIYSSLFWQSKRGDFLRNIIPLGCWLLRNIDIFQFLVMFLKICSNENCVFQLVLVAFSHHNRDAFKRVQQIIGLGF